MIYLKFRRNIFILKLAPRAHPTENPFNSTNLRWQQTAEFGYLPNRFLMKTFLAASIDRPDQPTNNVTRSETQFHGFEIQHVTLSSSSCSFSIQPQVEFKIIIYNYVTICCRYLYGHKREVVVRLVSGALNIAYGRSSRYKYIPTLTTYAVFKANRSVVLHFSHPVKVIGHDGFEVSSYPCYSSLLSILK